MKKITIGGVVFALAIVLAIAAFVVAIISNSFPGYDMANMSQIVILSILAIALGIIGFVLPLIAGNKKIFTLFQIAFVVVLSLLLWAMVEGKTDVWGTVIFSDLERGFPPADNSAYTGVAATALYLAAGVVGIIANFCNVAKK